MLFQKLAPVSRKDSPIFESKIKKVKMKSTYGIKDSEYYIRMFFYYPIWLLTNSDSKKSYEDLKSGAMTHEHNFMIEKYCDYDGFYYKCNHSGCNTISSKKTIKMENKPLDIKEAIQIIVDKNNLISAGAKIALEDDNKMIEFTNEIVEQCAEEGTNQERLETIFGKEVITTILQWNKRKGVEQDVFVMNKCIEEDMKAEPSTKVKMHMLLTPEVNSKRPKTIKELMDWGQLSIIVGGNMGDTRRGWHCVIEDTPENLFDWFMNVDELIVGSGSPQLESFTIYDMNAMNREDIQNIISTKHIWK